MFGSIGWVEIWVIAGLAVLAVMLLLSMLASAVPQGRPA